MDWRTLLVELAKVVGPIIVALIANQRRPVIRLRIAGAKEQRRRPHRRPVAAEPERIDGLRV